MLHISGAACYITTCSSLVCRWDGCFVRLLDGLLQASALDPAGCNFQLRIPTRIRRLAISAPGPALLPGSDGGLPT